MLNGSTLEESVAKTIELFIRVSDPELSFPDSGNYQLRDITAFESFTMFWKMEKS